MFSDETGHFYLGGGLNVLRRSIASNSANSTGANIFFGIESRSGMVHPFAEARLLVHDQSSVLLVAGLNFTLSSH